MRPRAFLLAPIAASLLIIPCLICPPRARAQADGPTPADREAFHQSAEWREIAPHLPDPKTATAAQLENEADVLQARRFPEDALDYYAYAIKRGGPVTKLLNKMGVVELELGRFALANTLFQQTVRVNKNDPVGWNNLGVTEYMQKHYGRAVYDYRKASHLNKASAVYHINVGMAYFESDNMNSARKEFAVALKLDPHSFDSGGAGGSTLKVVGTQNPGQLAFEMAKVYARQHDETAMMLCLSKATEAGFDSEGEIPKDPALAPYLHDPRVVLMLSNARELKAARTVAKGPVQSLGPASGNGRVE